MVQFHCWAELEWKGREIEFEKVVSNAIEAETKIEGERLTYTSLGKLSSVFVCDTMQQHDLVLLLLLLLT